MRPAKLRTFLHDTFSLFPFTWYRCPKCDYESSRQFTICSEGANCQFEPGKWIMVGPDGSVPVSSCGVMQGLEEVLGS